MASTLRWKPTNYSFVQQSYAPSGVLGGSKRVAANSTPNINTINEAAFFNDLTCNVGEMAYRIGFYYIPYHLRDVCEQEQLRGLPKNFLIPPQHPPELFLKITRQCTQIEREHSDFFEGVPNSVAIDATNARKIFLEIARNTFVDGTKNWGRILTIFTLAGRLAVHFVEQQQMDVVTAIPTWIQDFVDEQLKDWIEQQGGWNDLQRNFGVCKDNSWGKVIALGGVCAAAGLFIMSSTGMT